MNQNNEFYTSPSQPFLQKKNAAYYRSCARETMKRSLGIIVGASLLAALSVDVIDSLLSSVLGEVGRLFDLMAFSVLVSGLLSFFIPILLGGPIKVGYEKFRLDAIDGKPLKIGTIFSRFTHGYGKAALATFLYQLISYVAFLPMAVPAVLFVATILKKVAPILESSPAKEDLEKLMAEHADLFAEEIPVLILLGGLILIGAAVSLVLHIVLTYRYVFATTIIAEFPEISVGDAFRNSATMMKGRKWKLFCLECSFIGWMLLAALAGLCTCGVGTLAALLFLIPYLEHATTAFYDDAANRITAREAVFPSLDPNDYSAGSDFSSF